ncbi:hypothetical protein B0H16DRAFT_1456944 [Mycena metata]|uniref:Uncharacterized protein n=1 Tax=Mycena metata TaxID=1033252 RepID=A0AAD7JAI1_9AGAR|nr:hypothetical protein B0H16DRAFT_1456944 [Mycena metata]
MRRMWDLNCKYPYLDLNLQRANLFKALKERKRTTLEEFPEGHALREGVAEGGLTNDRYLEALDVRGGRHAVPSIQGVEVDSLDVMNGGDEHVRQAHWGCIVRNAGGKSWDNECSHELEVHSGARQWESRLNNGEGTFRNGGHLGMESLRQRTQRIWSEEVGYTHSRVHIRVLGAPVGKCVRKHAIVDGMRLSPKSPSELSKGPTQLDARNAMLSAREKEV